MSVCPSKRLEASGDSDAMWYDLAQNILDDRGTYLQALRAELDAVDDNDIPIPKPNEQDAELFGKNHMHLPFALKDGAVILLRVDVRPVHNGSRSMFEHAVRSEIATMKALRSVGLPIPAVYTDAMCVNNHICFALQNLPGMAPGERVTEPSYPSRTILAKGQVKTLIEDLADFYIKLSTLQYPFSGMIQPDGSVGPIVADASGETLYYQVQRRHDYFRDHIQCELDERVQSAPTIMHILVWLECEALLRDATFDDLEPGVHYILHTDDKAAQYLLDESGHLQGVLDWEWTITTSKADAFSGPLGLLRRSEWDHGANELNKEERFLVRMLERRGRPDLAQCVSNGKKYQRLRHVLEFDPHPRNRAGLANIQALQMAVTGEPWDRQETWATWVERKSRALGDDPRMARFRGHSMADVDTYFAQFRRQTLQAQRDN